MMMLTNNDLRSLLLSYEALVKSDQGIFATEVVACLKELQERRAAAPNEGKQT
jgi:hypothetical protein